MRLPNLRTSPKRLIGLAAILWIGLVIGVSIAVVHQPGRSIFDVYRDGVAHWWAAEPLYRPGMRSFVYLTSSPLIFTPFAALGRPLDDRVWRVFSVALFIWGLYRLARLVRPADTGVATAIILLLMLPCAGVDVQRGQASVAMAGWVFLGAAAAAEQRWIRSALWLCLALALKPLAIVPLLLFGAAFRPLRLPLALGVVVVLAVPFLHPNPAYVVAQDIAMVRTLTHAADLGVTRFNDIAMMLDRFGIDLPVRVLLMIRALAAVVALALTLVVARRADTRLAALLILATAMTYLMLFNPRTELGNYMGLAAIIGVFMVRGDPAQWRARVWLAVMILAMGTQGYGSWIYRPTDVWLKPLLALVFAVWLIDGVVRPRSAPRLLTETNRPIA
jgi:alpha-1,2-mannosyltransferase